ncbi:MAG TPA: cytochrome P450 [Blastococcus sp.]|nr:cytochrome P450 [Blastococcus sp.]
MTATQEPTVSQDRVKNFDYTATQPAGQWFSTYDSLREQFPWYRNEFAQGFWTFVNHEGILQVLQDPETFSSSSVVAMDPDPAYKWIPEMLDGAEHTMWRQQLGPLFSPKTIDKLEDKVRSRAVGFIEAIQDKGECDFMLDFAQQYPSSVFLELMGLPFEDLDQFMEWEHAILHGEQGAPDHAEKQMAAMQAVMGYFAQVVAARREEPKDDIITKALTFTIDGAPPSDEDLLSFCLLMFMAGLDTVAVTLGWSIHHLATHPEDRQRLVDDPSLIPTAIEEFLRVYAIVLPSRKATRDAEVQGCQIKAGEMVSLPLNAATRDSASFEDAQQADITRSPNNHIAFGAGPHRCLGSHLARRELKIALEEWHKRIPHYRVKDGAALTESGGQLGLHGLPLEWDV